LTCRRLLVLAAAVMQWFVELPACRRHPLLLPTKVGWITDAPTSCRMRLSLSVNPGQPDPSRVHEPCSPDTVRVGDSRQAAVPYPHDVAWSRLMHPTQAPTQIISADTSTDRHPHWCPGWSRGSKNGCSQSPIPSSAPSTKTWKTKYSVLYILGSTLFLVGGLAAGEYREGRRAGSSLLPGLGRPAGGLSREKWFLPPPPTPGL